MVQLTRGLWPNRAIITAALAAALLTACAGAGPERFDERQTRLALLPNSTFTVEGLRQRYAGATHLGYSKQHGTQVEFLSPDGRAFLWYPGNRAVVIGAWTAEPNIRKDNSGPGAICFRYGPNTYNPVTRQGGGAKNCVPAKWFLHGESGYVRGDPFNLASGRIPFVMEREFYSLNRLRRGAG